jgi:hypothetical protein
LVWVIGSAELVKMYPGVTFAMALYLD